MKKNIIEKNLYIPVAKFTKRPVFIILNPENSRDSDYKLLHMKVPTKL